MKKFMEFFKDKTGIEWADRKLDKLPPPKCNDDGETLPPHEGWFHMETQTNIFTDYLKSWQEPAGSIEVDPNAQSRLMTDDSSVESADHAAMSEELSQNHALLASLMSKELDISDRKKVNEEDEEEKQEENEEEESVSGDSIRAST